jgi:uncharacterized protein
MSAMAEGMLCPTDRTPLVMSERQGIEIDYCPTCRGVWLDRGELDKIIERSAAPPAAAAPPPQPEPCHSREPYRDYDDGRHYGHRGHHGHKRRKSFLEELFD